MYQMIHKVQKTNFLYYRICLPVFLFILFSSAQLFGQNYQAVFSDRVCLFEEDEDYAYVDGRRLRAIRIDSVEYALGDSVFLNFPTVGHYDEIPHTTACYTTDGESWLGERIRIKENGDTWFYNNYYEDSTWKHHHMILKTKAALSDSWLFYEKDSFAITASVIGLDTLTFLGVSDSVKEIELILVQNSLYYGTIILSKHHGLLKTIIFRDVNPDVSTDPMSQTLIGITNPSLGYQPITRGDIYDYEIGDVFHKNIRYSSTGSYYDFYETKEVINKVTYPDTNKVTYYFERYYWGWPGPGAYTFEHDTILKTYTSLHAIYGGEMPFETDYIESGWTIGYNRWYHLNNNKYNGRRIVKSPVNTYVNYGDTCYYLWMGVDEKLMMGGFSLGIVGCGKYDMVPGYLHQLCNPCNYLRYFRKGSEEWGTPITPPLTVNDIYAIEDVLKIYPNPAFEVIKVELPVKAHSNNIMVVNVLGEKQWVHINHVSSTELSIEVSSLASGMYFIVYVVEDRIFKARFLVK